MSTVLSTLFSPRVGRSIVVSNGAAQCPQCLKTFTFSGYKRHKGSKRCGILQEHNELVEKVNKVRKPLRDQGKKVMTTNTINALKRRNLEDLCGVEYKWTGLLNGKGVMPSEEYQQWWVHGWVKDFWNSTTGHKFYNTLEEMRDLTEEDRERMLAMILLRTITDE